MYLYPGFFFRKTIRTTAMPCSFPCAFQIPLYLSPWSLSYTTATAHYFSPTLSLSSSPLLSCTMVSKEYSKSADFIMPADSCSESFHSICAYSSGLPWMYQKNRVFNILLYSSHLTEPLCLLHGNLERALALTQRRI
jgi:hypothetical protein